MKTLALILVLFLIAATPYTTFAHGGEVRLELNVTQASPGATIDLRGSGFEPDDTTTIMLVSTERQQLLGSATTDDYGDLAHAILLPIDLTNGAYEVRVVDAHHVAAAPLNIVPNSNGDEEGSQRGEEEPLLAPMPVRSVGAASTSSIGSPNPIASSPPTETSPAIPPMLLFSSVLGLVILMVGLVVVARRSQ